MTETMHRASLSHGGAPRESPPAAERTLHRWWRGRADDHPAARPALVALLLVTAALYLIGLGSSGWANAYYSAAAQAGSASWSAMFFGASDAAGSITVDKTPMSLWVMAVSVRLFGLSSWSLLVPQALMGVASVALLHATVRRTTGNAWAGLAAGLVLATTPVAVLMFRFNNPDALLVLLLVASVWATLRAMESPRRAVGWVVLAGTFVGLAFLTKMLQATLVLPALAVGYLVASTAPWARRLLHLLAAFAAVVVSAGWWVALVELWPAGSRPYIGGSQNDSVLELTLGYNGLGRLNGEETGSVGGGMGWGEAGWSRLLTDEIGGQVAWLLPAAIGLLLLGLWARRRSPRTDRVRAALIVWGLWLVVTATTFSLMAGIFHAYYTVALAPAIAALVGIGGHQLWIRRDETWALLGAAFLVATTATFSFALLGRTPSFLPPLRWIVLVVGLTGALVLAMHRVLGRRVAVAVAIATLISLLAGPTAYAVDTAASSHTGSIPSAGPSTSGGPGGGGPGGGPGGGVRLGQPPMTGGQQPGAGAAGGLLEGSESSREIDALLRQDADSYTWVAAAVGSNTAAGYQLSTERPVMAIGGFNGSDPSPTLAQFQALVADGEIHWFIASGRDGGGAGGPGTPGGSTSTEISDWVEQTFDATTTDGVTLYDLSGGVR